ADERGALLDVPARLALKAGRAREPGSWRGGAAMKKAALYARVSTLDQHPETQLLDLEQLAAHRGWQIVETYVDHGISGTRVRRPALDKLMADAARHKFDIVAVAAFDRMARSVRHLLETLDEFHRLGLEFVSIRESIDSAGP